jgi:hypothetical protein
MNTQGLYKLTMSNNNFTEVTLRNFNFTLSLQTTDRGCLYPIQSKRYRGVPLSVMTCSS